MRKHLPNGCTAQNKYNHYLFIRQRSPDRGIRHPNCWWTLQSIPVVVANVQWVESCESTTPTDVLLRINIITIYSYDKGPQTEESAILAAGVYSHRRSNVQWVESCESTTPTDALLRINLITIYSYDKGPQTEESAILAAGGLCNLFLSS